MSEGKFHPQYTDRTVLLQYVRHVVVTVVPGHDRPVSINVMAQVYNDHTLNLTDKEALRFLQEWVDWAGGGEQPRSRGRGAK